MAFNNKLNKPKFRWIRDEDYVQVETISKLCDKVNNLSRDRIREFASTCDHIPKVLIVGKEVVGYCFYVLHKNIVAIDHLAVMPKYVGAGYEKKMLSQIMSELAGLRRVILSIAVCETDLDLQIILRSLGFVCFKTVEGDKRDSYIFRYDLPEET